jgi:hypothetical protein
MTITYLFMLDGIINLIKYYGLIDKKTLIKERKFNLVGSVLLMGITIKQQQQQQHNLY